MNPTLKKFGYPDTRVKEFQKWVVVLRPQQVTLGSMVLICQDQAKAFSQISPEAFAELSLVTQEIEASVFRAFRYEKINYLMLMMVDPDVHFHVIPRYGTSQVFCDQNFVDSGWPGPPQLTNPNQTTHEINHQILNTLIKNWGK